MLKQLNLFGGLLNLIIALWLGHWSLSFWHGIRDGKNGVTQAMLFLISALSLDRFRVAATFFARIGNGDKGNYLFEQAIRIASLVLIIGSLANLYYKIEDDLEKTS